MDAARKDLTATSYALLGQLALRPWSVYDMTRNVGRTLHWFWPRAESVLYSEVKRLASLGLASVRSEPGARGRPRAVYSITAKGRRALRAWLSSDPGGFSLHFEPLLRVHLAHFGTKEELLRALEAARTDAHRLLRQGVVIGTEFASGRHQFQEQVHVRAILFDYLWSFGLGMYLWAERSIEQVQTWPGIDGSKRARGEGVRMIRDLLAAEHLQSLADGHEGNLA
ncbi:MAG: PadR family transcriptional regulator [Actinomycetota bacterium]